MSRELVDRKAEQATMLDAARDQTPALIVMIGRRRVGKSFLLSQTFNGPRVISFQGDEQSESAHLALLAQETGRVLLGSTALRFDDWDAALEVFASQAHQEPLVVILDEFQWLKAAQPALDSIIARHWDRWDREGLAITLVLSGSALTLMENLLERNAPLYGRASARPRLGPLDYRDSAAFAAASSTPEELLRRWAVLGGTPQYQLWAGKGALRSVISGRVLAKDSPLYDDPRHLLREGEGIRDPGTYLAMLRAIAGGATTFNQIATRAGISSANLRRRLDRLEDLGYIEPVYPLGPDGREDRTTYQITGPYFRSWFRYVAPNRSRLESGRVNDVLDEVLADMDNAMGWAFEHCCRQWVAAYADDAAVGSPREVGSWWSRRGDIEVDVVGARQGRYVLLGSCKWRKVVDERVLDDLEEHQAAMGKARGARLALFARDGFTNEVQARAQRDDVLLVTAADLF